VPITAEDHTLSKKVIFGLCIKRPFVEQQLLSESNNFIMTPVNLIWIQPVVLMAN